VRVKRVAILIAASPTSAFYSQIAALRLALRHLPWSEWQPSMHVYVGGPHDPGTLTEWSRHLDDVDIHWTSPARFAETGDWAQSDDVFLDPPPDADAYLAMDADTFPVGSLEPVLDRVLEAQAVAGVIAHYPPFLPPEGRAGPDASSPAMWRHLARGLLDIPLTFPFTHTLMDASLETERSRAPFYLNFGVVFFPGAAFHDIAPAYLALRPRLMHGLSSPDFSGQVALTLAIAAKGAGTWALPMRYNFPNDPIAERMYPTELEQAVVYHYLRTDVFDRHQIFTSADSYEGFLALPLEGGNRRFQDAVRRIVGDSYPFA
jgi:hypothetical protein